MTNVRSQHVLGLLRITLKDITGLFYLNSPKSFPQLQHVFPRSIRGERVTVKRANIQNYVTIFAELKFGARRLRIQATTNKRTKSNHAWRFANRTAGGGDYTLTDVIGGVGRMSGMSGTDSSRREEQKEKRVSDKAEKRGRGRGGGGRRGGRDGGAVRGEDEDTDATSAIAAAAAATNTKKTTLLYLIRQVIIFIPQHIKLLTIN